jgi:ABC-type multidrug transport system ATPase subunit
MRTPLLEIKHVEKRYKNIQALKGVSLTIFPGEILALLGINGAGKTTLSSIIATLHPPTAGDILFKGDSIFTNLPHYRRNIGYCQQKPNLNPSLTLKDNLIFAGKYYGMNTETIEKRLEELNQRLGINHYLGSYSNELSGGWKQRYMIARTLIHSPQMVILDEPTVGLDPDIRQQLWYYIKHLRNKGITVLLTTHYIEEAEQLSDRVCVLHAGKITLIDTPQNLMKSFQKGKLEDVFMQLTQEQKE